jgi:hypothetical protein
MLYGGFADGGTRRWGRIKSTAAQYRREILTDLYFRSRVPLLAEITEKGLMLNLSAGITTYVAHHGRAFLGRLQYSGAAKPHARPIRVYALVWLRGWLLRLEIFSRRWAT